MMFCKTSDFIQFAARYGHRVVIIDEKRFLIFGGGNGGFITDATIYDIEENSCQNLPVKFANGGEQSKETDEKIKDSFKGIAAFGMVKLNGSNNDILIFGGTTQESKFTNHLYRLENFTNLRLLKPIGDIPSPRLGHSFTKINDNKIVMFAGMGPISNDRLSLCFSNETFILHINDEGNYRWEKIQYDQFKTVPTERESHSALLHGKSVIVYGGSNGRERLADLWRFNTQNYEWSLMLTTGINPIARSMHSAVVLDNSMYVFGGFIASKETATGTQWKCTNSMQYVDLNTCKFKSRNRALSSF
jgi:hypothetical protein